MKDQDSADAAERALWLAEIAETLDEATRVVSHVARRDTRIEVFQLYAEIEALKLEVQSLRLRPDDRPFAKFDPEWMNLWSEQIERAV